MGSWLLPAQESSVAPGCFGDSVRKLDINRSGRAMFRKGGGGADSGAGPEAQRIESVQRKSAWGVSGARRTTGVKRASVALFYGAWCARFSDIFLAQAHASRCDQVQRCAPKCLFLRVSACKSDR